MDMIRILKILDFLLNNGGFNLKVSMRKIAEEVSKLFFDELSSFFSSFTSSGGELEEEYKHIPPRPGASQQT